MIWKVCDCRRRKRRPGMAGAAFFAGHAPGCVLPFCRRRTLRLLFMGKASAFSTYRVRPPPRLRRGICVSSERAYCRQASQEALKKSAACITCPTARKRAPFIQDYLSGNRKVVHLFPLRPMLEAKAFLLSPALLGGISLKHTRQKPQQPYGPPRFYFSSLISPCFSSKRSIESRI